MSLVTNPEELRRAALAFQRQSNALPAHHPDKQTLARAAEAADRAADEIEAMSPAMRDDLEAMIASIRAN